MMPRKDQPGTWRLRVYIGRTAAGKPKQVSKQFRGGQRDAETELARFLVATQRKYGLAQDDVRTVEELLYRWVAAIEDDRSLSYVREARRRIEKRLVPAFGRAELSRLAGRDLSRTYRAWHAEGLSPTTIRGMHSVLSAALHWGEKEGIVDRARNPAPDAILPTIHARRGKAIKASEITAILAEADRTNPVLATAIRVAVLLGVRRGELCALRWPDIDSGRGVVRVSRALTVIAGQAYEGDTKTHQDRELSLGEGVGVLQDWRQACEKLAADAATELAPDAFVLSRRADGRTPVTPDSLTQAFGRACARLELPYHFHDLRHAMASAAVAARIDPVTIADRLGHADPSLTLRVYSHAGGPQDTEVADLMAATLGAKRNTPEPGSFT